MAQSPAHSGPAGTPRSPLVREYANSVRDGLAIGSTIDVPPQTVAVVVSEGAVVAELPPGAHPVTPEAFPSARPKGALTGGAKRLPLAVFLVQTEGLDQIPWEALWLGHAEGSAEPVSRHVRGWLSLQAASPAALISALHAEAVAYVRAEGKDQAGSFQLQGLQKDAGSLANAEVARISEALLGDQVSERVLAAIADRLPALPNGAPGADLQQEAREAVSQHLQRIGVECTDLRITEIEEPGMIPCARCGSNRGRTFPSKFRWTVSLLIIRYQQERGGYFCFPCALQLGLGYSAIILVAGWWGIIGLILSPFYLIANLFNLLRVTWWQLTAAK